MSEPGFWHRQHARGPAAAGSHAVDPFTAWEHELTGERPPAASARRELAGRLTVGALSGFLVTGVTTVAWATIVVHQVFGDTGSEQLTARWLAASMFGALIGMFVAYSWPQLTRIFKLTAVAMAAVVLLVPGAAEYLEARTGHLTYAELHELAQLGGRSVCQIDLPARSGWPAGRYWMLNSPTNAGTLVTAHGGDVTWRHRYPSPMICLP